MSCGEIDDVGSLASGAGLSACHHVDNTSSATYWPWLVYQDSDGVLFQIRNRLWPDLAPAVEGDVESLNITVLKGTRLAVVPLISTFIDISQAGGYGVIYQDKDSRLSGFVPSFEQANSSGNYNPSWPPGPRPDKFTLELEMPSKAVLEVLI
ncbi:hypothetical protein B0T17DRAFT_511879 [Bombardia bombarda]|uniref:Uncharacterized protein n=1 Tax=Bombardia bombarda TaxID=252184 RepID=A0AA39WCK0_9PEZI|nr:hypothetical protein B0T17DRAFT_511879 [Bombardia bombarda]